MWEGGKEERGVGGREGSKIDEGKEERVEEERQHKGGREGRGGDKDRREEHERWLLG